MFVVHGTFLQNKITLIECQNQNIFDTNNIGGSLSISLETLDFRENVLTSTKRCLHYTVYTKKLEDNNSGRCPTGNTKNGNRHRVLNPPGGNGENPCGLPKNSKKVKKRGCKQRFAIERCNPLLTLLWRRPPKMAFKN